MHEVRELQDEDPSVQTAVSPGKSGHYTLKSVSKFEVWLTGFCYV